MDGTLNIKVKIVFLVSSCFFISCQNEIVSPQQIIEEHLLSMVDTLAYSTGSFLPPPPLPGTENYQNNSDFQIVLSNNVTSDKNDEYNINSFFNKHPELNNYRNLHMNGGYSEFKLEEKTFRKTIGRYHIIFNNSDLNKNYKYAGQIFIKNFKFSSEIGYLVLIKAEGKNSVGYIVLFKKLRNKWHIIRRELLYVS